MTTNLQMSELVECPSAQAQTKAFARRVRRFQFAFRAGAKCVMRGAPGLSEVNTCKDVAVSLSRVGPEGATVAGDQQSPQPHAATALSDRIPCMPLRAVGAGSAPEASNVSAAGLCFDVASCDTDSEDVDSLYELSEASYSVATDIRKTSIHAARCRPDERSDYVSRYATTVASGSSQAAAWTDDECTGFGKGEEHTQGVETAFENILDTVYEIVAGLCCRDKGVGDKVEICGLQGAVELNGRRGRIVSVSEDTLRFGVKLDDTVCCKSVQSVNLKVLQGGWVDIAAVTSIAASWSFSGEEVGEAIEDWEALGVMGINQDRTKVRFVTPFLRK